MLWLTLWIATALIGVLGIVVLTNSLRFRAQVAAAARSLWPASAKPRTIDRSSMNTLPEPVQRYLNIALAERSQVVSSVRFRHGGRFRARLDGPWQTIRGEQYEADDPPGFVWWGRLPLAPGLWVDARDKCVNGAGHMFVSAESTFTLSDRTGPQMDQGSMLRLLSDLVLFPSAMLNAKYLTWSAINDRHAQATLTLNGHSVSGTFEFGDDDLPRAFHAERYMDTGVGQAQLLRWSGEYLDYRRVAGMMIPHHFIGYWHLNGKRIPYVDFLIDTPEYDRSSPFDARRS